MVRYHRFSRVPGFDLAVLVVGGGKVSAEQIQELEKMTQELVAVARKLPHGRDRETVLQEIREFRAKISMLEGHAAWPKVKK